MFASQIKRFKRLHCTYLGYLSIDLLVSNRIVHNIILLSFYSNIFFANTCIRFVVAFQYNAQHHVLVSLSTTKVG